jgi:pentatricopeptide repeat protein
MLIHNPMACACGNKNDIKEALDMLEKMTSEFTKIYKTNSKKITKKEIT